MRKKLINIILLFVATTSANYAYALQPYVLWKHYEGKGIWRGPVSDDQGNVYYSATWGDNTCGDIASLDKKGQVRWRVSVPDAKCIAPDYLYIDQDNQIYGQTWAYFFSLDPEGKFNWVIDENKYFKQSVNNKNKGIIMANNLILSARTFDVNAYTKAGKHLWHFSPEGDLRSVALGKNGLTAIVDFRNQVFVLDNKTGKVRWKETLDKEYAYAAAVADDNTVYITTQNNLVAYDGEGKRKWSLSLAVDDDMPPVIAKDGTIYAPIYTSQGSTDQYPSLAAVTPNGQLKWTAKTYQWATVYRRKPQIGPKGNIYILIKDMFYPEDQAYVAVISPQGKILSKPFQFAQEPYDFSINEQAGVLYTDDNRQRSMLYAIGFKD